MEPHPAIVFLGGLVVIIVGAEMLLRGATRMAAMLNIQPILIGLTLVAICTSTPELAVGITAAYEGRGRCPWATSPAATSSSCCSCSA